MGALLAANFAKLPDLLKQKDMPRCRRSQRRRLRSLTSMRIVPPPDLRLPEENWSDIVSKRLGSAYRFGRVNHWLGRDR